MRPARAAPGVPFVNLPLRQSPNACAGDCRGIFDPVVPYKPPRLTAHLTCSNLALAVVNMTSNCNGEIQPACDLRATTHRPAMRHVTVSVKNDMASQIYRTSGSARVRQRSIDASVATQKAAEGWLPQILSASVIGSIRRTGPEDHWNLTGLLLCSAMGRGLPISRRYSAATLISLSRRRRFRPAVWPAGIARVFGTVCPVYLRPDNRPRSWTAVGVTRF